MPKPCRSAVLAKEKRCLAKGSAVAGKRESGVGTAGFSPKPGPTRPLGAAERKRGLPSAPLFLNLEIALRSARGYGASKGDLGATCRAVDKRDRLSLL